MWLIRFVEFFGVILVVGFLIAEVLIPAIRQIPLFPDFRSKTRQLEDEQKRVNQILADQAVAEEIAEDYKTIKSDIAAAEAKVEVAKQYVIKQ